MRIRAEAVLLLILAVVIVPAGAQLTETADPEVFGDSTGIETGDSLSAVSDDSADVVDFPVLELVPDPEPELPEDPVSIMLAYHEALRSGDGEFVLAYTSSVFLDDVEMMLEGLKENLDRDRDGTMARMSASGYTATAEEMERWDPSDYLAAAVAVPLMKNRYSMYLLEAGEPDIDGNDAQVPLTFTTMGGASMPFLAELRREDGIWKVSTFLGLNSFP